MIPILIQIYNAAVFMRSYNMIWPSANTGTVNDAQGLLTNDMRSSNASYKEYSAMISVICIVVIVSVIILYWYAVSTYTKNSCSELNG